MENTTTHIEASLKKAYSYEQYKSLINDLLKQGKSTTEGGSEALVEYSKLNKQRMKRWDKTFQVDPEMASTIKSYDHKRTWLVISEGWCGDAAHIVPIMHKVAELNPNITLRIVLREQNEALMNDFLTNGGKSIPKLIMYNPKDQTVENTWGPRPEGATKLYNKYKKQDDFEALKKALQQWYNKDKGQSIAHELVDLLND